MKIPDILNYEFIIEPGTWSSVAQFEYSLTKFFKEHELEIVSTQAMTGQGGRAIMWIMKKPEIALPKAPKSKFAK